MWIPYCDAVVVVTCNPLGNQSPPDVRPWNGDSLAPLRELLAEIDPTAEGVDRLSFADLRDRLLAYSPLDVDHVRKVNAAEAQFWRQTEVQSRSFLRTNALFICNCVCGAGNHNGG